MKRSHGALLAAVFIALPAILFQLIPGSGPALQWERDAMTNAAWGGEWWRVITCHWVHWGTSHFAWDTLAGAAMAGACWVVAGPRPSWRTALRIACCVMATAIVSPLLIRAWLPEIATYRGLSDIDSALFALLVATLVRGGAEDSARLPRALGLAMLLGIVAKTAYEIATGATLFVDHAAAGFTPLPLVHAAGIVVGLAAGGWPEPRHAVPLRGALV
ncbi:MAG: rhombosortase [Planctomycetota bacterium]|nr:rhombosortase [Planctomycetota bacterium]